MTKQLQEELERVVSVLKDNYHAEKIILFGSSARKQQREHSDLDLVVIKNTTRRFYDRIGDVLRLVKPTQAIDVLVYTPQEYDRLVKESWFVGEEIAKKGRILYQLQ